MKEIFFFLAKFYRNNFALIGSLIITTVYFSKYLFSFYFFPQEDLITKIISDSPNHSYFHYIKAFSDLDFSKTFSNLWQNDTNILVPVGSILLNSFFYKLIGNISFLLCEFIYIFLFIYLLTKILTKIEVTKLYIFSIIFFTLFFKNIIYNFDLNSHTLSFASDLLFSDNFPRPLVSNVLYLFSLYLLTKISSNNFFEFKNIVMFSIILSLLFSSSFFIFFSVFLTTLFYLFLSYKIPLIVKIISHKKLEIIISVLAFLIFSLPFIYLINTSNEDYFARMGIVTLNYDKKILLLKYYLITYLNLKNLIVFFTTLAFLFLINKKFINYKKFVNLLFINLLSSYISPVLFIILSPSVSFIYHFNNLIILNYLLFYFFTFSIILKNILFFKNNLKYKNFFLVAIIIFSILNGHINTYKEFTNSVLQKDRYNKNNLIIKIKNTINVNCSVLTFDNSIMTWMIFHNYKNISYINGTFTNRTNDELKIDLVIALKILGFKENDFRSLLESEWDGWRLKNSLIQQLFWQTYQANQFKTFENSKDFEPKNLEIINNSKPSLTHQIAIPRYEKENFIRLFNNFELTHSNIPNYIIINKKLKFWNNYRYIDPKLRIFENLDFIIFKTKKSC
jgi:hypothetical protein